MPCFFLKRVLCLHVLLTAFITGPVCAIPSKDSTGKWTMIKGSAQGTTYSIKFLGNNHFIDKSHIDSILNDLDLSLSLYRKDSRISFFNQAISSAPLDTHLRTVITTGMLLQKISNGAFDIRLYNISQAWGFGPYPSKRAPSKRIVKRLKPDVSDSIWITGDYVFKSNPELRIDLDGLAQGYSVDVLASFFDEKNILHYMIELGGEIRTSGLRQDGTPWRIGVESPRDSVAGEIMMVSPKTGAITTSGSYRKTRNFGGRIYSHVIDPRTARPIENGMLSCTIIAPNAILADALDNVGMVLGPTEAIRVFSKLPSVDAFFVWRDNDGRVHTQGTPGFFQKVIVE